MNSLKNILAVGLLAASFSAATVSAAVKPLAEKYQFDELPEVKGFSNWSINGWTAVDRQSLIVRTSPSTAYLLILQRRAPGLRSGNAIALSSTASRVHAKFDTVSTVDRYVSNIPIPIAKIYKLKGKEQRKQVKAQIREG